jgi:hypothetical protein
MKKSNLGSNMESRVKGRGKNGKREISRPQEYQGPKKTSFSSNISSIYESFLGAHATRGLSPKMRYGNWGDSGTG